MLGLIKRLHTAGVVGINRRNANYTLLYNQRHLYPLVDDKLQTKKLAQEAGITVPELYAVVEIERQIKTLPSILHRHSDFVVKPAMGSGGDGIIVITGRMKSDFVKISGNLLNWEALAYHLSNTLSGMYSLGGHPDKAIIEYRVKPDPVFSAISFEGVPDIRIIVFLGVPVMAMVRLPTRLSDGKANLHQGAIGAGVDIASGKTLTAVWKNHIVEEHPDTGNPVTGVLIPGWERLLELAARCYDLVDLGYFGVDFVLDRQLGPMILEINARPGLNIQIANNAGLGPRLEQIAADASSMKSPAERINFARTRFATGL